MKLAIGNVSLNITLGLIKVEAIEQAKTYALQYLTYHKIAGQVFKKDKHGVGRDRKDAYSDDLATAVKTAVETELTKLFATFTVEIDAVETVMKPYVPTPDESLILCDSDHEQYKAVADKVKAANVAYKAWLATKALPTAATPTTTDKVEEKKADETTTTDENVGG